MNCHSLSASFFHRHSDGVRRCLDDCCRYCYADGTVLVVLPLVCIRFLLRILRVCAIWYCLQTIFFLFVCILRFGRFHFRIYHAYTCVSVYLSAFAFRWWCCWFNCKSQSMVNCQSDNSSPLNERKTEERCRTPRWTNHTDRITTTTQKLNAHGQWKSDANEMNGYLVQYHFHFSDGILFHLKFRRINDLICERIMSQCSILLTK